MLLKTRTAYELFSTYNNFDSPEEAKIVAEAIREEQWRLQNILKNPGPSASDKAKIVADKEVQLPCGTTVTLDSEVAFIALTMAEAFHMNELLALDLVLTAEIKLPTFEGLSLGLVSVILYYETHRLLAESLRILLSLARQEDLPQSVRSTIKSSFSNRGVFRHLIDLQSSFTVANEFHTLATQHKGLGNTLHQNTLRSLMEETQSALVDCVYLIATAPDFMEQGILDLLPIMKKMQPSDRFGRAHLVAWCAALATVSPKALQTAPSEAARVLQSLLEEARNETGWSDVALCGCMQLAVAIGVRRLQLSPVDHAAAAAFVQDMEVLVTHAIGNMAFRMIRSCIVNHENFHSNTTQVEVVDALLKSFILLFPPKACLMEMVRHSEDELAFVDECAARGSAAAVTSITPSMHLDQLLRAITEIYVAKQPTEATVPEVEALLDELSTQFGLDGSQQLVQFCEMATRPQHPVHAVSFIDLLNAVCRTPGTARCFFEIFYQIGPNDDGWVGWEQLMAALRAYERLFRDGSMPLGGGTTRGGGGVKKEEGQMVTVERSMHKYELAGLVSWLQLAATIVEMDDDASMTMCEERGWNVVELCASLVAAPVPLKLKGALMRLLGALGRRRAASMRVWTALASFNVCLADEAGQMGGLQRELEEKECPDREYPSTLGCVYMLRSLLVHPLPAVATPFLHFLTRSVIAPLGMRSYNDVHQMWDLAATSLDALHSLVQQTHIDTFAVSKRMPQVKVLLELLNDSPLFRSVSSIISEDVSVSQHSYKQPRPSATAAFAALRLLLAAANRLAPLRSAIRAADSDAMLATLESLFFSSFGHPDRGCLLQHIAHYLSKAMEQPLHALYAARLLRELSAVKPSLHRRMVDMLKCNRPLHLALVRAVRALLSVDNGPVRYSVEQVNLIYSTVEGLNEADIGQVHGEAARILLEIMAEGAETEPRGENLASFLLGFEQHAPLDAPLYPDDTQQTGVHSLLFLLDVFVSSPDPFALQFSALFEPAFRLILRLVGVDSPRRGAVLRLLRTTKTVYRLVGSPFIREQAYLLTDDTRFEVAPTVSAVSAMITGNILHLAAIELSYLLSSGQIEQPRAFYEALLESRVPSTSILCAGDSLDGSAVPDAPLLFALLKNGRTAAVPLPETPVFACFDTVKVQKLLDACRGSAVFEVEQYDVAHVHWLLQREIASINIEDATQPNKEMEAILLYVATLNGALLVTGSTSVLIAGCAALLNVFALHSPVPFFSPQPQLDVLLDASFVLAEAASSPANDVTELVAATLLRMSRAFCALSRVVHADSPSRRALLSRLLLPLLELIVEPTERTIPVKLSLYGAVASLLRECAVAAEADERKADADADEMEWLLVPVEEGKKDPVREALSSLSTELLTCVTRDILDLPVEHTVLPTRVLTTLLEEDARGARTLCSGLARNGLPRALLDLAASLRVTRLARDHPPLKALNALLVLFTRMALSSDALWWGVADLAMPELLMGLDVLALPPKQLFLDPASLKKPGTESAVYAHTLTLVLRACSALLASPNWKSISLQVVALLDSISDLLTQLMRAEVDCDVVTLATKMTAFVYEHDDVARPPIDASRTLSALRSRGSSNASETKAGETSTVDRKPAMPSFITPSRLFAAAS